MLAIIGLLVVGQLSLPSKGIFGKLFKEDFTSYPHPDGEYEARVYYYKGEKLVTPIVKVDIALLNQRKEDKIPSYSVYMAGYRNENYQVRWLNSDSLEIVHNSDYEPMFTVDSTYLMDSKKIYVSVKKQTVANIE